MLALMNAPARMGIPLRPDPGASRERSVASFVRAALAIARSRDEGLPAAERLLAKSWPNDATACAANRQAMAKPITPALMMATSGFLTLGAGRFGNRRLPSLE